MSDSISKTETRETDAPTVEPEAPQPKFSALSAPRIFIRSGLIKELEKLGLENEVSAVTRAVNAIVEHYIAYRTMEIPTMVDLLAVEQDLSCRLRELTVANLEIAKI